MRDEIISNQPQKIYGRIVIRIPYDLQAFDMISNCIYESPAISLHQNDRKKNRDFLIMAQELGLLCGMWGVGIRSRVTLGKFRLMMSLDLLRVSLITQGCQVSNQTS
jgi:hypothetical protein